MKYKPNQLIARKRMILASVSLSCLILGAMVLLDPRMRSDWGPRASKTGNSRPDAAPTPPPAHLEPDRSKDGSSPQPPAQLEADKSKDNAPAAAPADSGTPLELRSSITDEDLIYLASRNLLIPLAGKTAADLRDNFNQGRSEGRLHNALDIMAAQGTPVLAAADGTVTRLFQSDKGGITLYQLDSSGRYVYYYAHLMNYADGMAEGRNVHRGDLIAYVGDTGNAGAGNYHLHFAISKVSSPRQWSGGDPINPYPFLTGSR